MARAVSGSATDLVGLARPLAAEPHLCADILSGASEGAKPNVVTDQLQTGIAIMQLGEVCFLFKCFCSHITHTCSDRCWQATVRHLKRGSSAASGGGNDGAIRKAQQA